MFSIFITKSRKHPEKPNLRIVTCPKCKCEQNILPSSRPQTIYCAKCFSIYILEPEFKYQNNDNTEKKN